MTTLETQTRLQPEYQYTPPPGIITSMRAVPEFQGFPKMARLSRECIVTEKIDGTNAQIFIDDNLQVFAGSRTRWITPQDDNYGFAAWVAEHQAELRAMGPGRHFGEWWGRGINRNYGLTERCLSLFNVTRWCEWGETPQPITDSSGKMLRMQEVLPQCVELVPVLYRGPFETESIACELDFLRKMGSTAAPGFMNPEGIVIYHTAGNVCFKKTLENDSHKAQ